MKESGGYIKNNSATNGGGVYVGSYGKFQIETGTVYGTDGADNKNTAFSGNALFIGGDPIGTAQCGPFKENGIFEIETDFIVFGNAINITINVEGGGQALW